MLKNIPAKTYFLLAYILVGSVQIYAAFNHQLFGDEAFYWLEGQWLASSYSEVPGWTPWTHALMDWLFPKHQFFIRIPNLVAAFSIPWLGIFISRALVGSNVNCWLTGMLLLSLPILGVAGILAIPDIWLVFFTLLSVWYLIQAMMTEQRTFFITLGLVLAIGINVHLRFWLIILITCGVAFWQFKAHRVVIFQLLKFTLPMMLLGFIPVLIFNVQHDFPLLSFQLKDRHPWEFQASHISFFLTQIVITTPWVFYLCIQNLKPTVTMSTDNKKPHALIKTIIVAAGIHWLLYAVLGFFSDNLRLNVHWTLVSYVLLLIITVANTDISLRLRQWAVVTGITATLWLLLTLSYWLSEQTPQSQINTRITDHAKGWQQLAAHTDETMILQNQQDLLVDHYMTLAQLQFYAKQIKNIKSLPHPLNRKHGRSKQLEIMGLLEGDSDKSQLLVVEHSALKLTEVITFYQSTCALLNGIKLIDSLDVSHGLKRYHYFVTGGGICEIPPIVYYEVSFENGKQQLSGWILNDISQNIQVTLYDAIKHTKIIDHIELSAKSLGSNSLFEKLNTDQYQILEFNITTELTDLDSTAQLRLELPNRIIYSQRLMLNQ